MPSFTRVSPLLNGTATLVSGNCVIIINDTSGGVETFKAKLFPFTPGMGSGPLIGQATFAPNGVMGQLAASIPDGSITGPPPMANNREVHVEQVSDGDGSSWSFKLGLPGSGVGGGEPFQVRFCQPGQLLPVALLLKLGSKVTKGTCAKCSELNKPTLLVHAQEANDAGCWYSQSIAFCGKDGPEGIWMLERSSTTKWTLILKQADKVLVTYTAKTKPKDCTLPIRLDRKGEGKKACKDWPKTVTIKPAP